MIKPIHTPNPVAIIERMLKQLSTEDLKALGAIEVDFGFLVDKEILRRPKFEACKFVNYKKLLANESK